MILQITSTRVIILYEFQVNQEDNIDLDLGGLMKLFNQFNFLPRYLYAFNYAGLNLNENPKEIEQYTPECQNLREKELQRTSNKSKLFNLL